MLNVIEQCFSGVSQENFGEIVNAKTRNVFE